MGQELKIVVARGKANIDALLIDLEEVAERHGFEKLAVGADSMPQHVDVLFGYNAALISDEAIPAPPKPSAKKAPAKKKAAKKKAAKKK